MRGSTGPLALFFCTFLTVVGLATIPGACGGVNCKDPVNATKTECVIENNVLECAGSNLTGALTTFGPEITALIQSARQADGSINWAGIETQLVEDILKYGGCVVAAVFEELTSKPTISAGANTAPDEELTTPKPAVASNVAAVPPLLKPEDASAEFTKLSAKALQGHKVKLPSGLVY